MVDLANEGVQFFLGDQVLEFETLKSVTYVIDNGLLDSSPDTFVIGIECSAHPRDDSFHLPLCEG